MSIFKTIKWKNASVSIIWWWYCASSLQRNSKWDSGKGVFLWILWNLSAYSFIENETQTQVFSCEFWNIFWNNCFVEHLWTAASYNMIIASFFYKIYCSLKCKKRKSKTIASWKCLCIFLIFLTSLKTTIILLLY